ncbi:MAG: universal stress protein [Vicinamibacterales bacterium]
MIVRPFEVVFLTNFSNLCFRAIPSLAQMSDDIDMRLTIVHAAGETADTRPLENNLRNFFSEADAFSRCRRILERGTPVDAVQRLATRQPIDLVVAPAGDPLGMPRIGHRSLRSRLVRECPAPVWTHGPAALHRRGVRRPRRVACVVEEGHSSRTHLQPGGRLRIPPERRPPRRASAPRPVRRRHAADAGLHVPLRPGAGAAGRARGDR